MSSTAFAGNQDVKKVLRWAADTEGGAPSVFYMRNDHRKLVGFDCDIIYEIARRLNMDCEFSQNDWDGLIPGLQRGMYDVVIDAIIPSAERSEAVDFSIPYFVTTLALVTKVENNDIGSIFDCRGKKVGSLKNSEARQVLARYNNIDCIDYHTEYSAFSDLRSGRVSAVLIDLPSVLYYGMPDGDLKIVQENVKEICYVIAVKKYNTQLLRMINSAIDDMKADGTIKEIANKWGIFGPAVMDMLNDHGKAIGESINYDEFIRTIKHGSGAKMESFKRYVGFLPVFLSAALVTLEVSISAMFLAIFLGFCLAILRLYTPRYISFIAISFIEFIRGTPLLIQLFLIFYGVPCIGITLNPILAGIITLGVNYSAFEAENFRAGLLSVPNAQMEAARALGMSQWQALRYVIVPQAFTFVLPPLTNDFIALLKDSSLVSLITIVELTKAYTTIASTYYDYFITGLMVAVIYFLIGFPFVRLARYAEHALALEKKAYKSKRVFKKK